MVRKAAAAWLTLFAAPVYAHGGEGFLSFIQLLAAGGCLLLLLALPKWPDRNLFAVLGVCGGIVVSWMLLPLPLISDPQAWSEAALIAFILGQTAGLPVLGFASGLWLAHRRSRTRNP